MATISPDGSLPALTVGQSLNPYSHHYSETFAFSILLYLLPHQLLSRVTCHASDLAWSRARNQAYHVPSDAKVINSITVSWLGPAYPPMVFNDDVSLDSTEISDHVTFWLRPVSSFGLLIVTGVQPTVHLRYPCSTHLAPKSLLLRFSTAPLTWAQCCECRRHRPWSVYPPPLPAVRVQVGDGRSYVRS
jgi:hypothetical protein